MFFISPSFKVLTIVSGIFLFNITVLHASENKNTASQQLKRHQQMQNYSIRDAQRAWGKIEEYLSQYSDAKFSHSICPKCIGKARSEAGLDEK